MELAATTKPSNNRNVIAKTVRVGHRVVQDVGTKMQQRQLVIRQVREDAIQARNAAALRVQAIASRALWLVHLGEVVEYLLNVSLSLFIIPSVPLLDGSSQLDAISIEVEIADEDAVMVNRVLIQELPKLL